MVVPARALIAALAIGLILVGSVRGATAAESTTGVLVGTVTDTDGHPIAKAYVAAASPSGRYEATTDAQGRFTVVGVIPDSYVVSIDASGYQALAQRGVLVLAGQAEHIAFQLERRLESIGSTRASTAAFSIGATTDTFTVSGDAARALTPNENSSGLAQYSAGTVQGAIAAVPGVDLDTFGNAILRGGKVSDTVFDYDSVPVPQGLIAEPGGNIVGAQLATVGIAATTVTMGGFGAESQNALAGVVDEIPLTGTYPARSTFEIGTGSETHFGQILWQNQWATPDLRWRYSLSTVQSSEYFPYGNGTTFYPSEEGTYGLSLQSRGESATAGNVHFALTPHDDLGFVGLVGEAAYQQYGLPYPGETYGGFNCQPAVITCNAPAFAASYPTTANPNAQVNFASGLTGTYDILKLEWAHSSAKAVSRYQLYQSQYGVAAGGPFWDDLSFPDGVISLQMRQGGRESGLLYDVQDVADDRDRVDYGLAYRENNSFLDQIVPTADEYIHSNPTLFTALGYLSDTWTVVPRLDVTGTGRQRLRRARDVRPYDGRAGAPRSRSHRFDQSRREREPGAVRRARARGHERRRDLLRGPRPNLVPRIVLCRAREQSHRRAAVQLPFGDPIRREPEWCRCPDERGCATGTRRRAVGEERSALLGRELHPRFLLERLAVRLQRTQSGLGRSQRADPAQLRAGFQRDPLL
jgi:hypothetical protein